MRTRKKYFSWTLALLISAFMFYSCDGPSPGSGSQPSNGSVLIQNPLFGISICWPVNPNPSFKNVGIKVKVFINTFNESGQVVSYNKHIETYSDPSGFISIPIDLPSSGDFVVETIVEQIECGGFPRTINCWEQRMSKKEYRKAETYRNNPGSIDVKFTDSDIIYEECCGC